MFNSPLNKQKGDFLLESLVGVVLMAILATGMAHISSRVSESLGQSRITENAKTQMRKILVEGKGNFCDGNKVVRLPSGDITVSVGGCDLGVVEISEIEEDQNHPGEFVRVGTAVPVTVQPPKALKVIVDSLDIEMGGEVTSLTPAPTPVPGEGDQNTPQT